MKLTKYHRKAFVLAVLADIPQIDYYPIFAAAVLKDMIEVAPKELAACLKNAKLRHHVMSPYLTVRAPSSRECDIEGGFLDNMSSVSCFDGYEPSVGATAEIKEIAIAHYTQRKSLDDIERKLEGAIGSCSTRKVAVERMPEFAKYLPHEELKSAMLPALANLTGDLIKLGWPKGGEKVEMTEEAMA